MTVEVDGPVEEYLAGVRAALADLPASEVEEILDDVRGHLADLRREVGRDADGSVFTARLGPPHAYAAELRAAAGYPAPPQAGTPARGRGRAVLAVVALVAATGVMLLAGIGVLEEGPALLVAGLLGAGLLLLPAVPELATGGPRLPRVAALPVVQRLAAALRAPRGALAFVVGLQSAWWVLRALVAVALVGMLVSGGPVVWLVLAVLFVPLSVGLGHLSRRDRRWVWPVVPLNAFAAVLLPALLGSASSVVVEAPEPAYPVYPGLWQDGDRQITDIRPVDSTGRPLTGVYLFDQDGRPLDVGDPCDGYESDDGYGGYDGYSTDRAGSADPYPRGSAVFDDETGECSVVPPPPLVVAVPSATPTPSASPTGLPVPPASVPPASVPPASVPPAAVPPASVPPASAGPAQPAPPPTAEPLPSPAPPTG